MSRSTSATSPEPNAGAPAATRFPTETEIYLLPDGRVIVADLPAELVEAFARLGTAEPCALPEQPTPEQP